MFALAACLLLLASEPAPSPIDAGAQQTEALSLSPAAEPRVRFGGAPGAAARRAVLGAHRRLMAPSCSHLLSEFKDPAGEPLQSRLDELGLSAPEYATTVLFVDGSKQRACGKDAVLGVTQAGSRVVFLCPRFADMEWRDPRYAEAIVIHEMLHSLGLNENPPSSWEITTKVLKSCTEQPRLQEWGPASQRRPSTRKRSENVR